MNGKEDNHTINKYGSVDWDKIGEKLSIYDNISLDYELLMNYKNNETMEDTLKYAYNQAIELENKIKEYQLGK